MLWNVNTDLNCGSAREIMTEFLIFSRSFTVLCGAMTVIEVNTPL